MTSNELRAIFAANLAARRRELGLTQTELAERAGTSHASISRYESGKLGFSDRVLATLAEALQTTPEALLSAGIFSPAA